MVKVYIDGQEGTTGLKIIERFENRDDIQLIKIDEDKRKNPDERKRLINSSDYTFLCLPDVASMTTLELSMPLQLIELIQIGLTVSLNFRHNIVKRLLLLTEWLSLVAMLVDLIL